MRVIGIDPAPRKGLSIFDGQFRQVAIEGARTYISTLEAEPNVLICWDAPLTGPPAEVTDGGAGAGSNFTQRPIEKFFSRKETGFKTPPGISVLGYSGCPHWAVSRSLIGLPRTGPYDLAQIPFSLAADDSKRPLNGRNIVEVHPALALWLWCRQGMDDHASWKYKTNRSVLAEMWNLLLRAPEVAAVLKSDSIEPPCSDDELDARIAYTLGSLWLSNRHSVKLLGDVNQGTFLLPQVEGMQEAFDAFVKDQT